MDVLAQARLVIVTGARPQVSALLEQAGIEEEFRDDLRVTSKDTLKVTERYFAWQYRARAVVTACFDRAGSFDRMRSLGNICL